MLTVKKGDNEIDDGRQEESVLADILRVLEANQGLSRTPDWEDIDASKPGVIHETAPAQDPDLRQA
jgi:hypothetical protein